MLGLWEFFWSPWGNAPPIWAANPVPQPYAVSTFKQLRQAIAQRLFDVNNVFWSDAEIGLYLNEALRTWNAVTGQWRDTAVTTVASSTQPWFSLNLPSSPRQRTVTDAQIYSLCQLHLLEPNTGAGTYTGTSQFQLSDFTQALQRRQDEILQLTANNLVQLPLLFPSQRRTTLPDTVLDVRRARFLPNTIVPPGLVPQTLGRADIAAFRYYTPSYLQAPQTPRRYAISNVVPLTVETDYSPNVPGALDLLAIQSSTAPNPPNSVNLGIPDDWFWVLKWGVLYDLLSKDSESQDLPRADYCLKRYEEGIMLMQNLPWLLAGEFNNVPVGVSSVAEKDQYDVNWEFKANARRAVVVAGVDLIAISPRPTGSNTTGLSLEIIRNAPIPVNDGDFVQVSRDVVDDIIDYSCHLAAFKMGGAEFLATIPLLDDFRKSATLYNQRLHMTGLFDDILKKEGNRQEEVDPRYPTQPTTTGVTGG